MEYRQLGASGLKIPVLVLELPRLEALTIFLEPGDPHRPKKPAG